MLKVIQEGEGEELDLFLFWMGDLGPSLRAGAPRDRIIYGYCGAGTSKYQHPPTLREVEQTFPGPYKTRTVMGWSAGGRAVECMIQQGLGGGDIPDAAIIADGLYAPARPNGLPDRSSLTPIIEYARRAALEKGPRLTLLCSSIQTPGYASSSACCAAVLGAVEAELNEPIPPWEGVEELVGRPVKASAKLGQLRIAFFAGSDEREHVVEANLIDEMMRETCPWASDLNQAEGTVVFDEVELGPAGAPTPLGERVLKVARSFVGAREDGGENRGRALEEMLRGTGWRPGQDWCAAALVAWTRLAAGIDGPTVRGLGAQALVPQYQALGSWIPAKKLLAGVVRLEPGMTVVWKRRRPPTEAEPNPPWGWQGHCGVVAEVGDGWYRSVEGNVGDAVAVVHHRLEAEEGHLAILGAGVL